MVPAEIFRKVRQIEISTRRLVNDTLAGEYQSVFKGQGMEFREVRQYSPGDEVRSIDWNVTARMSEPYVRRYHEERELSVMLVVDASGSADFGSVRQFKRELAAELAAVLSFAATTNNDRVGLLIFTDRIELLIPPRKGRRHVLRLIRDMLVFEPQGRGTDIKLALDTVNLVLRRHSVVFLVSDFLADPEQYRQALAVTNRRHDVVAMDLHDPMERDIPDVGLLVLEDAETGALRQVDTSSRRWRNEFEAGVRRIRSRQELRLHELQGGQGGSNDRPGLRGRPGNLLQATLQAHGQVGGARGMPRDCGFPSSRERRGRMSKTARLLALVLSASLALAAYGTASAQAPPDVDVSLTAEIDDAAPPTVGDPITFTLTVTHPPGYRVTFPRLYGIWGAFEVRSQSAVENADHLDGTRTTSQSIEAVLFETGDFTTPDVPITVRDSAGQVRTETASGASVTVVSVLTPGDEPKDIKPPAEIYQPPFAELTRTVYERAWVIAGAVLALLLVVAAYLLMRGRGRSRAGRYTLSASDRPGGAAQDRGARPALPEPLQGTLHARHRLHPALPGTRLRHAGPRPDHR